MPEVFVETDLMHGGRKISKPLLSNSGTCNAELLIPNTLAKELGLRVSEKVVVEFGGIEIKGKLGSTRIIVRNPKTGGRAFWKL